MIRQWPQQPHGVLGPPGQSEGQTEIDLDIRRDRQRLPVGRLRLVAPPEQVTGDAEIVEGGGIARIMRERGQESAFRRTGIGTDQRPSEADMGLGSGRIQSKSGAVGGARLRYLAHGIEHIAARDDGGDVGRVFLRNDVGDPQCDIRRIGCERRVGNPQ